jgi:hypothetical protein
LTVSQSQPSAAREPISRAGPDAELVSLLVAAYDHLEDIAPDPEFEEPDEELDDWLAKADAALKRVTGQSARELVEAHLAAERATWRGQR